MMAGKVKDQQSEIQFSNEYYPELVDVCGGSVMLMVLKTTLRHRRLCHVERDRLCTDNASTAQSEAESEALL